MRHHHFYSSEITEIKKCSLKLEPSCQKLIIFIIYYYMAQVSIPKYLLA